MTIIVGAAWCMGIAGIVLGAAALIVFRQPLPALRVTMEMFIAAGLLRLSVDNSWAAIAGAAIVIAVRRMITRSLTADFTRPATTSG
ncbi:MAG: hypothetical protein SW019_17950 [Actinomycetota bacterium]|nr:hypothetical protein [Actinomycetota bacterium]